MAELAEGNSTPKVEEGTDPPEGSKGSTFSKDDVIELVNKAITGRFRDNEKKQSKQFEEFGAGLFTKFDSSLAELRASLAPKEETKTTRGKEEAPQFKLEEHPEFQKVTKQLAEQNKALAKATAERESAYAKQRDVSLRQSVNDELGKQGITGIKAKLAVGHLVDASKVIGYGDDESIVFRADDESIDLSSGVKRWLKTDEGKEFLPPRNAAGSGDRQSAAGTRQAGQTADVWGLLEGVLRNQ